MAGIILAGGLSTRLGQDKAFVRLNSETLIEMVISTLKNVVKQIIIVANEPEKFEHFVSSDTEVVQDRVPYQGPLGGILAGLEASPDFHNLVSSCDTPFLRKELCHYLLSQADDFDVVVPTIDSRIKPLPAIYSKNCSMFARESLEKKTFRIISFFPKVKVKPIETDILRGYDPELVSFLNVNTEEDLKKAKEIYRR